MKNNKNNGLVVRTMEGIHGDLDLGLLWIVSGYPMLLQIHVKFTLQILINKTYTIREGLKNC